MTTLTTASRPHGLTASRPHGLTASRPHGLTGSKPPLRHFTLLLLIAAVLTVYACQKEELLLNSDLDASASTLNLQTDGSAGSSTYLPTIVGDTVTNPYSLGVVREAYQNLSNTDTFEAEAVTLRATDLHIRFLPRDTSDERRLSSDSSLTLFDVALDRLVLQQGDGYRDPDVSEGTPTYLYAAVDIDKNLADVGVPYLILDSLYQPDMHEDPDYIRSEKALAHLEEAATTIAKGKSPDYPVYERRVPDYFPTARIRYLEDDNSLRGLEGAQILFKRWSKTGQGFTDANGLARSDKGFNYEVNYELVWERYNFAIKDGLLTRAKINGPHQSTPWNLDINIRGDRDWRRAQVHRGAFRYFYQNILGLNRPPLNGVLRFQLHYRVRDQGIMGVATHNPGDQWLGFGSQIQIGIAPAGVNDARGYVAITIHETAHAAHWNNTRDVYNVVERSVTETYAVGVEHFLTRTMYPNYTRPAGFLGGVSTGVAVDAVDAADGLTLDGGCCADRVTGFTPVDIQTAVYRTTTWFGLETELRDNFGNPTAPELRALFAYWR